MRQLEHNEIQNQMCQFPLCVICDNITSPENVGMIFRICEAMGVEQIYLCGDTPTPQHKKVQKTSRSTEKYVSYSSCQDILELISNLKQDGYMVLALEITDKSKILHETDFNKYDKIAVVIGNEQHGVAPQVLKNVNLSAEIRMFGKNTSINVVNSLSIALYEITRQID